MVKKVLEKQRHCAIINKIIQSELCINCNTNEGKELKPFSHFKTITYHRFLVCKGCFAVGLYYQGLVHDLSKYSPEEFLRGARYYQGYRSPNNAEREDLGYSAAWLHHKGRNKHHFEYWIDFIFSPEEKKGVLAPVPMPERYIVEMYMDRLAASKVYKGDAYRDIDPYLYYKKGNISDLLHPQTKRLLEILLLMNARYGEEVTFRYIRTHVLNKGKKKKYRKHRQKKDKSNDTQTKYTELEMTRS